METKTHCQSGHRHACLLLFLSIKETVKISVVFKEEGPKLQRPESTLSGIRQGQLEGLRDEKGGVLTVKSGYNHCNQTATAEIHILLQRSD